VTPDSLEAVHRLCEAAPALPAFFGFCLIVVFIAGIYVFRKRRTLFGQDANVTNDTWAVRNLRFGRCS
jgi:4-hydroxybenzoate polyprenyltransferase